MLDPVAACESDPQTRRDLITLTVHDLVRSFVNGDRKEDDELPRGSIEEAIAAGEVTVDEIVDLLQRELQEAIA